MFLRILGQHFHFNFHPIQAILRQISVFIKCSKHLQCFCVEIPLRINFDNQKIFFSIFFSKTAWISLKSLPKQPIATFRLKSRLPYNTTYGRATQAVSTHCSRDSSVNVLWMFPKLKNGCIIVENILFSYENPYRKLIFRN